MTRPQPLQTPGAADTPSNARIYDYLLGGKDNFQRDRDLAAELEAQAGNGPGAGELARINRAFVLRAVRWVSSMTGAGQILDLGCGLPSRPAVHEVARETCPETAAVYVDRDPVAVSHAAALMGGPGLAAVKADVSDPARVLELVAALRVPGRGSLIDLARPACVILGATLSAMDADTARAAVKGFAAALVPRSAVIISCASWADPETGQRVAAVHGPAGSWHNHGCEDVASFFAAAGLRVIHGQPMDARCWPACPLDRGRPGAQVLAGIGIVE